MTEVLPRRIISRNQPHQESQTEEQRQNIAFRSAQYQYARRKISKCTAHNGAKHGTKLRPPIAGRTVSNCGLFSFQLRAEEPAAAKRYKVQGISALCAVHLEINYEVNRHCAMGFQTKSNGIPAKQPPL